MEDSRNGWVVGAIQLVFILMIIALALIMTRLLTPETETPESGQIRASEERTVDVSTMRPVRETFAPIVDLNGVVQAQTQTNITPQVGGRVVYVSPNFRPGALVERGETLFRIDPSDYELSVEQAQANIDAAASDLALLEAEAVLAIEEWDELFPGQPITDLAARKPQIAAAQSRLASAEAAKKTSQLALSRTRVTAPSTSRVLSTTLNVGQVVSPNAAVGALYALDSVEVSAPLSTLQLDTLMPVLERAVTLTPRGNNAAPIAGVVARLDATLDPRTRQASIYIRPETLAGLTVGDFVDITLKADPVEGAMAIPSTAFFERSQVWIIIDGKLEQRTLTQLGERAGTTIVKDFDYGEGVITLPPVEGYEGMKVSQRPASKDRQLAGGQNAG